MYKASELSHAYIISGHREQTSAAARELAAAILCSAEGNRPCKACRSCEKSMRDIHPDIIFVRSEIEGKKRREIYIDQIRAIVSDAPILPNEAERKCYVVEDADTMNTAAQNAFLKCLEEPPKCAAFILCVQSARALLETVRSRCVLINCAGASEPAPSEMLPLAERYLAIASKADSVALLDFCGELEGEQGAAISEFAQCVKSLIAKGAYENATNAAELLGLAEKMDRVIQYARFNVGAKHIVGFIATQTIDLK